MPEATVEPVRSPSLSLTPSQLRTSEALNARLQRVHDFCYWMHRGTGVKACSRVARRLAVAVLPRLDQRLLTPTVYGFSLCVTQHSGTNYYYQGFYEPGTLAVMQRFLRPGDVFVDAGASVGLMSMRASQLVGPSGTVLAFEPHPERFVDLTNSVAANQASNVLCFPCGLGTEATSVELYTDLVSPSMIGNADKNRTSVQTRVERLDDVLAAQAIERVQMIKVDVEGFELKVLRGGESLLRSADPPVLCVEHGVYGDEPFLPWIESLGGYRMFQLARTKAYESRLVRIDDPRALRAHDNVFCVPDSKLSMM